MARKLDRRAVVGGLALAGLAAPARAAWPDRPITIVHGFAAGGNADVVSRIVADALQRLTGYSFIVEIKAGAGGTIAAAQVARAAPDGYTLGVLPGGHAVADAIYKQLNYRSVEDFNFISMITDFPFVLATHAGHAVKTFGDLLKAGREAKEPLLWASAGNGTGQHLSGELLAAMGKLSMRHVPYRGGTQSTLDLLAGRIDLMMDTPTVILEHVRSGGLRALAVTGTQRFFALPDTPTIAEAGLPGYETSSWLGLVGPAALPADIAAKLNAAVATILADPAMIEKLRGIGSLAKPTTGDVFRERVASDIAKWRKVVEDAKIERI